MKSKYEISVWTDVYNSTLKQFVEQKEIVIGSDTMTSESRAREPKLVNNINGTNQFTFNMYYRYIDTRTGEEVENPYIPFLVNERKIKVFWKDEWYDMLIKSIKEDQAGRYISYTCEDCYITELSRTGFELEFATELENNIGTAQELVERVIEDTDWRFDTTSDKIYQLTEEAVYETQALVSFTAKQCPLNNNITISRNATILVYYSCAQDNSHLKTTCQFYLPGSPIEQDQNDMLVINGKCCSIDVNWTVSGTIATAVQNNTNIFRINFATGLSTRYRAERYVQSQKSAYYDVLERYVSVFQSNSVVDSSGNPKLVYGYESTEYNDALAVVNLITNASNFKDTSGWYVNGDSLYFQIYPPFNSTTEIASYTAKSYFRIKGGKTYFNQGIQNNRSYISNGFIQGEHYIFRIKAQSDSQLGSNNYINTPSTFTPIIAKRTSSYEISTHCFEINTAQFLNGWLEYNLTCIKTCPYDSLLTAIESCGIFIQVNTASSNIYWIEEVQFYREIYGTKNGQTVRINPNELDTESVATQVWKYFYTDQPGTTKNSIQYLYTSIGPWDGVTAVYNQYERYGTIEAQDSNRFNILQSIAETFQCWVRINVKHDSQGYITRDSSGKLEKYIRLTTTTGQETGIGFVYGIDLTGVVRNIKSNQISTKTIVLQNENEFGKNGFCSIARSQENYPRENVIYNFDYYVQQGLLNGDTLKYDLYNSTSELKYYPRLNSLNTQYADNLEVLINKKAELTRQEATQTVYDQYLTAATNEKASIEESVMKLAGVDTWEAAIDYAEVHYNDTKVHSLINDRTQVIATIDMYTNLKINIDRSITNLKTWIDNKEATQDNIITQLRTLNKAFYTKYARYIQEGTWSSEDYWNDDLYYLDAIQVAYQSSRPQISYDINVLRLSELDDYSSKIFKLGDISYIQDIKYFGYKNDGITPYKEKVMLSEITSYFDTPDKDIIKVQNYKTQFDDLFQRITAATQNLEFSEGKYAKAANIVQSDGTIKSSVIQNTFNSNKDLVYGAQNESVNMDNTGITVTDNGNAANLLKITSGGVFVSADAGNTWKNAIRGDGINTELLTAGRINTEEITVYNGDYPSFRWDSMGINAYKFSDSTGAVDTTQFVRFDRFGIYGLQLADPVFIPISEQDIWNRANFGLTWRGFFLKNTSSGGSIEISTEHDIVIHGANGNDRVRIGRLDNTNNNYGIAVYDNDSNIVFKCDTTSAELSGWILGAKKSGNTELYKYLKSGYIELRSDGTIGSFASESSTTSEMAYGVTTTAALTAKNLRTNATTTIPSGSTIYVFSSYIGTRTTNKTVDGNYNSAQDSQPSTYPAPQSKIQVRYGSNNFEITNLTWTATVVPAQTTHVTQTIITGSGTEQDPYVETYKTTYTYKFNLTTTGIAINYNVTSISQSKYIAAHDFSWAINSDGTAIFHNITADGGTIAGWKIDNEKIYQTDANGNITTQLNSSGTATSGGIDYSIITDAIEAAIATVGGVLMQGGLINGYNIAEVANIANAAYGLASEAKTRANEAYNHLPRHDHDYLYPTLASSGTAGHTHPINLSSGATYQTGAAGT